MFPLPLLALVRVGVTGDFIQGPTATGVLVATLSTSGINFHLLLRERNQIHDTISNVEGGPHYVSVFVVEENGLPFIRAATIPQLVVVVNGNLHD